MLKDIEIFKQVSMQFHFANEDGLERSRIIFAKIDSVFSLDFNTERIEVLFNFRSRHSLKQQPSFFTFNNDQSVFIVASSEDAVYVNLNNNLELDLDAEYDIDVIK